MKKVICLFIVILTFNIYGQEIEVDIIGTTQNVERENQDMRPMINADPGRPAVKKEISRAPALSSMRPISDELIKLDEGQED